MKRIKRNKGGEEVMAKINIEAIIKKAVNEGINAGRREAEKKPLNAYKETERRLYALPDIIEK